MFPNSCAPTEQPASRVEFLQQLRDHLLMQKLEGLRSANVSLREEDFADLIGDVAKLVGMETRERPARQQRGARQESEHLPVELVRHRVLETAEAASCCG